MFRERSVETLPAWLEVARGSALASFAAGLERDMDAVREALRLSWSPCSVKYPLTSAKVGRGPFLSRNNESRDLLSEHASKDFDDVLSREWKLRCKFNNSMARPCLLEKISGGDTNIACGNHRNAEIYGIEKAKKNSECLLNVDHLVRFRDDPLLQKKTRS
jgi:hypothetical protein